MRLGRDEFFVGVASAGLAWSNMFFCFKKKKHV